MAQRFAAYRDNAELLATVADHGHVRPDSRRILDATWGLGSWWRLLPTPTVGADIDRAKVAGHALDKKGQPIGRPAPRAVVADFRRPPFRPGSFDAIILDADYKLNGTPDDELGGPDERYGAHVVKRWQDRMADLLDGVFTRPLCADCATWCQENEGAGRPAEWLLGALPPDVCPLCCREGVTGGGLAPLLAPAGKLLVKCQIQVCSGQVRHQPFEVMKRAEHAGLVFVDQFDYRTGRPQPEGRNHVHAESNYSTLLVFRRSGRAPRRRTIDGRTII